MDFSSFSFDQTSRLLEHLNARIQGAARSPSARAVHQLRVAIRRLRQALPKPCPEFRGPLKELMAQAGAVRDCDIALKLIAESHNAGSLDKDARAVSARLRARRSKAQAMLSTLCRSQPLRRISLPRQTEAEPAAAAKAARRVLPRLAKSFLRAGGRAAHPDSTGKQLHKLRLEAKKFRYTLELFAGCYGAAASEWLEQLKAIQALLGAISDCAVSERLILELGAAANLVDALKQRRKRKTRAFRKAWEPAAEGFEKWVAALRRPARAADV